MMKKLPGWVTGVLALGAFGILAILELRRPLRKAVEPKLARVRRNLAVSILGAFTVAFAENPVVQPLSRLVERRRFGMLNRLGLPGRLKAALAVILLDYTLYIWHRLMHRSELIWRLHLPHHVDLDLDASTAVRFHFGELLLSVPWRAGQIAIIGVSPTALSVWQSALMLSILFHHSNVRLPIEIERWLSYFIVTPRMHGIHHSMIRAEADSNFSSGLALWDRLHGTVKLDIPQAEVVIGVPAYRRPQEVRLAKILTMPFTKQRPTWRLPQNGEPARAANPLSAGALAP